MHRFGPGPLVYVATLVGVGLTLAGAVLLILRPDLGVDCIVFLVMGLTFFLVALGGLVWYRLDADGIHRRGFRGSKFVPWEDVDGVIGRRAGSEKHVATVLTQFVVDADGYTLLRLDPGTCHRRKMVRLIRATIAARRKDAPPRDE